MKEDKKVPQLRFPEFTDAWKQRELCSLTKRIQGNDGRMDLDILTISAGNGWMKQEERFSGNIAGKEQKNYTLLHKGELSYNHGNSKLAKYGAVFSLQNFEEALVPRVYHSFKMLSGSAKFIEYYFATKLPDRELGKLISSGARMDGLLNIKYDDFMGIKLTIPSEMEQHKISTFFSKLDNTITLQQRKLNSLQKLKKGLLQKMFPKNGENIPEIRFPEFSDAWKQRKLSESAKFSKGNGYSKSDVTTKGIPLVLYGRLYTNYETVISNIDTYSELKKDGSVVSKGGEILVPASGETAEDISRASVIKDSGVLIGGDLNIIYPSNDIIPSFLALTITNGNIHKEMTKLAQGKTVVHLHNSDLSKIRFYAPTYNEQIRITEIFSNIDSNITLQQRKLESLQKLKKGLLQQMFI